MLSPIVPNEASGLNDAVHISAQLCQQVRIERRSRLRVHETPKDPELRVKACFELSELRLWEIADLGDCVHVPSRCWYLHKLITAHRQIVANNVAERKLVLSRL